MITTVHGDGETAPAGEPAPPLSAEYIAIVERLLPVNPLTVGVGAIGSATGALTWLWKPAQLRRALRYTGPVLPLLAEAAGVGGAGQLLLAVTLRLAERALLDSDENSERLD
ncbi:hypothetical protein [Pseudonocardia sp. T1-2H]|uniref:hypothetical protein n=1 Tax=Pseudonocardia sp. T1-2H TaxID=3128899 RepID=UPI003100FE4E